MVSRPQRKYGFVSGKPGGCLSSLIAHSSNIFRWYFAHQRDVRKFFRCRFRVRDRFFSGDDTYKQDWVSEYRNHFGLEFIQPNNIFGRLLGFKRKFRAYQDT